MEFHECRLVGLRVLPSSFPERRGIGRGVEDVVDDLKRQTEVAARATELGEGGAGPLAAQKAAHHERGLDHRGRFVEMDKLELFRSGVGFFFGEHVFHLAADEAAAAGGVGEFADQRVRQSGLRGVALGEQGEGVREQRIAGEERGRFVELFVRGGTAAAEVIVVHARQVVVDERVGVEALDRDSCGEWIRRLAGARRYRLKELVGREHEHGTEAFSTGRERVAHRGVEAGGTGRRGREVEVETLFDAGDVAFEFGGEVHRVASSARFTAVIKQIYRPKARIVKRTRQGAGADP